MSARRNETPRKYDLAFKINPVSLVIEEDLTEGKACSNLSVGKSTLGRWLTKHRQHSEAVHGLTEVVRLNHEKLKQLERENEVIQRECDILKKR